MPYWAVHGQVRFFVESRCRCTAVTTFPRAEAVGTESIRVEVPQIASAGTPTSQSMRRRRGAPWTATMVNVIVDVDAPNEGREFIDAAAQTWLTLHIFAIIGAV